MLLYRAGFFVRSWQLICQTTQPLKSGFVGLLQLLLCKERLLPTIQNLELRRLIFMGLTLSSSNCGNILSP